MKLVIINYGMGNLTSVANAFASLGAQPEIIDQPGEMEGADRIVLPGVGAFGDGMASLRSRGWIEPLQRAVRREETPFLGICLGMQILAAEGTENGRHAGLGWIPGSVVRIATDEPDVRVPHIGWNDVRFTKGNGIFRGLGDSRTFYFVNSYVLQPEDPSVISGTFTYGREYTASIEAGPIAATQFHPEKSQKSGIAVLRNFLGSG
jgi:glutamine amidotransferase